MLAVLCIIGICVAIKQSCNQRAETIAPPIENFELYRQDILSGMDNKTLYRNQLSGRYKKPDWYDNPVVINDIISFENDVRKLSFYEANKRAKLGMYAQ